MKASIQGLMAGAALAALAGVLVQHRGLEKAQLDHDALTQRLAQLTSGNEAQARRAELANNAKSTISNQRRELARLRVEVQSLRDQAKDLPKLSRENQSPALWDPAAPDFDQLPPEDQFILRQKYASDAIDSMIAAVKSYKKNHGGQLPASFDQLTTAGLLAATNFAGNLTLGDFEFFTNGPVEFDGKSLLFRNRIPVPKPNDQPVWTYGSINGLGGVVTTPADLSDYDASK